MQKEQSKKKDKKTPAKSKEVQENKIQHKKRDGLVNKILFLVLVVAFGWLLYNSVIVNKLSNKENGLASLRKEKDVKNIINENKKVFFGTDDLEIKSIQKNESGLWDVVLKIKGDLQDFYLTKDGQIVLGTATIKEVKKSDKEEAIGDLKNGKVQLDDKTKNDLKKIIEDNLVSGDIKVEVGDLSMEHGLIKSNITINEQKQNIYLTPDGKRLVFSLMSVEEFKKRMKQQKEEEKKFSQVSEDKKNDKPTVEYFVMSYCPYGTQFEKGVIPVLRLLGDKIDANIRFVDYAMHGKKEVDENLLQYCIQKNQKTKFYDYLDCFLEKGKSKECLKKVGINESLLDKCIKSSDKKFKITANYNDKSTWKGQFASFNIDKGLNEKYGVGGSPTLIINGQKISTNRDPKSLLKAICSAFKSPPKECQKEMSSQTPSPGFGANAGGSSSSDGGCGQ